MYCESPEKAQSHIQPREVSPGLLLLMLSSVIREKLEVLQILQVWSAEQVASRLRQSQNNKKIMATTGAKGLCSHYHTKLRYTECRLRLHPKGIKLD